jgi:hypothetical protein
MEEAMRNTEALALGAAVGAGLYLLAPRRANAARDGASLNLNADDKAPTLTGSTGSAAYDARAARLVASIPRRIERTRTLIAQWSTYLDRYRGGLHRGVFAAAMQMESDGRPSAQGDASLGEAGLFQITEEFTRSHGFDPALRFRNDWNVYLAGTEYNERARKWHQRYPELIADGSRDAWLLSRLSFAIGDGGTRAHVKRALVELPDVARGDGVYAALSSLIKEGGARVAGSQSTVKVAYRIAVVVPVNFHIGEHAEPGAHGAPVAFAPPNT